MCTRAECPPVTLPIHLTDCRTMEAARSTAVLCKWSLIGLFRLKIVVWLNVLKWPDQAESGPLVRSGRMTAKRTNRPDAVAAKFAATRRSSRWPRPGAASTISPQRSFTPSEAPQSHSGRSPRSHQMSHMRTLLPFAKTGHISAHGPQPTFSRFRTRRTAA